MDQSSPGDEEIRGLKTRERKPAPTVGNPSALPLQPRSPGAGCGNCYPALRGQRQVQHPADTDFTLRFSCLSPYGNISSVDLRRHLAPSSPSVRPFHMPARQSAICHIPPSILGSSPF